MVSDIALLRYRERMGLTYWEALQEPAWAINYAMFVWSLDGERDKLEAKRKQLEANNASN